MVMKRRSYKIVNYFLVHSLSLLIEKPIGERMPQQATGFKFILFSNVLKVPLYWLSWFSFIQLITTFHPFTTSSWENTTNCSTLRSLDADWVGGQWELGKFFLVASHVTVLCIVFSFFFFFFMFLHFDSYFGNHAIISINIMISRICATFS